MKKEIEEMFEMISDYAKNSTEMIESYPYSDSDDNFKLSIINGTMIACTTSIIHMLSLIYEKLEENGNEK